jgi:DNA-binding protein HU-beta
VFRGQPAGKVLPKSKREESTCPRQISGRRRTPLSAPLTSSGTRSRRSTVRSARSTRHQTRSGPATSSSTPAPGSLERRFCCRWASSTASTPRKRRSSSTGRRTRSRTRPSSTSRATATRSTATRSAGTTASAALFPAPRPLLCLGPRRGCPPGRRPAAIERKETRDGDSYLGVRRPRH